jgi:hypothetical protein
VSRKIQSFEAFDRLVWYQDKESHVLPSDPLAYVMGNWMPPFAVHIMVDQKQLENVEQCRFLVSMITDDAGCTREIT